VKGIRHILNHHPDDASLTWPLVSHGEYLTSAMYSANFQLLTKYNFTFDVQLNPHQYQALLGLIRQHPGVPVAIDHLGTLRLTPDSQENLKLIESWKTQVRRLAAEPQVFMKLSMLWFTSGNSHACDVENCKDLMVQPLVRYVIDVFGPHRCMFASNYPVCTSPIVRVTASA